MIGVRYCGGCNPRYDRVEFVNKVKNRFKEDKEFENAQEGVTYEALMVVGGCQNCCAAYKQYTSETEPMRIWGNEFYEDVEKKISEICR